jgi:hypothetical protein
MKLTLRIAEINILLILKDNDLKTGIINLYSDYIISDTNNIDIEISLIHKKNWMQNFKVTSLKANLENDFIYFEFIKIIGKYNFMKRKGEFHIGNSPIAYYSLFRLIFSYSIAFFDGFYLHASAVFDKTHGLVATGISGAGKSTFALTLSKQNFNIIHDDLVLIRKINGVFKIYSLPFIEDPRFKFEINKNIPLTNLFFLGKSDINYIENMTKKEIYTTFMRMILSFTDLPSIFHDKYFTLINDLINSIKINKLYYNPNTINIKEII